MKLINVSPVALGTGIQELAELRYQLETLCQDLENEATVSIQQIREKLKASSDKCQLAFHKLGGDIKQLGEDIKQLREKNNDLSQVLKEIIEQGIY